MGISASIMNNDFKEQLAAKTDQELTDIYLHPDEFQESFVTAAIDELKIRNVPLDQFNQKKEQKEKIKQEELEKGIPGDSLYIVLAFISALLGGFIGIIAGVVYNRSKRNGYYFYDKKTREKGGLMIIIGAFVLTGTIIWRVG